MKQASTFDGQLPPVCPWCGQAGCQVWCKEVAREKSEQELQEWEHNAEAPLQMCFSKSLGCLASFSVVVVAVTFSNNLECGSLVVFMTVTYSFFCL